MSDKYLDSFYKISETMLHGLEKVYPGDIPIKLAIAKFNMSIKHDIVSKQKFCRRWWELSAPHQQVIRDGNLPSILQSGIPLIEILDIRSKTQGMSKQSQTNLLKFIQAMTECSRVYSTLAPINT